MMVRIRSRNVPSRTLNLGESDCSASKRFLERAQEIGLGYPWKNPEVWKDWWEDKALLSSARGNPLQRLLRRPPPQCYVRSNTVVYLNTSSKKGFTPKVR
jgi:hypothetical protein